MGTVEICDIIALFGFCGNDKHQNIIRKQEVEDRKYDITSALSCDI